MFEEIIKTFQNSGHKRTTVNEHYGVKDVDFIKLVDELLCSFIKSKSFNEVIDEHFPEMNEEQRAKIHAYAVAKERFEKYSESLLK